MNFEKIKPLLVCDNQRLSFLPVKNPSIYVACLASYNNGYLHGEWIEVTDEETVNEEIQKILASSPVGEAEEHAIHDYEGFGSLSLGEYESISWVCELAELMREHGEVILELYSYHGDLEYAKTALENNYYGEHKSEQDFSNDFFDDLYAHEIPKHLTFYINYEAFSRGLFITDFYSIETESGVHVFSNH